jgi:hypothetical protein
VKNAERLLNEQTLRSAEKRGLSIAASTARALRDKPPLCQHDYIHAGKRRGFLKVARLCRQFAPQHFNTRSMTTKDNPRLLVIEVDLDEADLLTHRGTRHRHPTKEDWISIQDERPKAGNWIVCCTMIGSASHEPRLIQWTEVAETLASSMPNLHWFKVPNPPHGGAWKK